MRRTKKITQAEYCPKRKPISFKDFIAREVRIEDEINHVINTSPVIPEFKVERVKKSPGLYVLLRELMP